VRYGGIFKEEFKSEAYFYKIKKYFSPFPDSRLPLADSRFPISYLAHYG
jgi:hypothetical protein